MRQWKLLASVTVPLLLVVAPADAAARQRCRRACAAAEAQCVARHGAPALAALDVCEEVFAAAVDDCGRRRKCRRMARADRAACGAPALSDLAAMTPVRGSEGRLQDVLPDRSGAHLMRRHHGC
jgi:hypothetical protein